MVTIPPSSLYVLAIYIYMFIMAYIGLGKCIARRCWMVPFSDQLTVCYYRFTQCISYNYRYVSYTTLQSCWNNWNVYTQSYNYCRTLITVLLEYFAGEKKILRILLLQIDQPSQHSQMFVLAKHSSDTVCAKMWLLNLYLEA